MSQPDDLKDDSTDLTDEEVAGATVTNNYGDLRKALIHFSCPHCSDGQMIPRKHALRRRKPGIYWRITLGCESGHEVVKTFRADWVEDDGKH